MCLNDRNRMGSWKQLCNVLGWILWFYDVKILIEIYSSLTCDRSAQSRPYADQPLKNIGYTSCSLFVIYLVLEDECFIFLILHIYLMKTSTNSSVEHTLSACCLWESYSFSPWSFCVWIRAIDLSLGLPSNDFTVQKKKKKIKDGWILGPRGGFRGPEFFCGHEKIHTRLPSDLPKVKWEVSTLIGNRIQSSLMPMQCSPCTANEYKVQKWFIMYK